MSWVLKYTSGNLLDLFEKLEERGEPTPLRDQPEIDEEDLPYWSAFQELHSSRPPSDLSGPHPLSLADIAAWLEINSIDTERRTFFEIIKALDEEWLVWARGHGTTETND